MATLRSALTFRVNRIYIISSILDSELQTSFRLFEDLSVLCVSDLAPEVKFIRASNKLEFLTSLDTIKNDCQNGVVPIIHIECHGDKHNGLMLASQEFVEWNRLVNKCREININCNYSLGLILAACSGLYAIKPITLEKITPYAYLIAPEDEILAGNIDQIMLPFYQKLFESNSMELALLTLKDEFKPFYAEKFLVITLAKYISRNCIGKGGQVRRERLLTGTLSYGAPNTKYNRRVFRKLIKEQIAPKPALLDKYSMKFLGRKSSVSFDELMNLISTI